MAVNRESEIRVARDRNQAEAVPLSGVHFHDSKLRSLTTSISTKSINECRVGDWNTSC